ncbi:hypothetical protein J2046_002448 [Rhizobium petrolearium]|nr:hypothetical protein [Neorhizobium petrolearium]
MIWYIQTRKPYPPTTPTATIGQMPKARMTNVKSSARLRDFGAPSLSCSVEKLTNQSSMLRTFYAIYH